MQQFDKFQIHNSTKKTTFGKNILLKTYLETLDFLFSQLPMYQRVGSVAFKKDLSNTLALCEFLNHPEKKFKSIHIAGTNGKGSVTHILAAILQEKGLKVGCYTSPHYKDFRERIKINGTLIPEQFVMDFVQKATPIIEQNKPSFFELTVGMAFDYFAEEKVDIAIIETGLGGRLDSTNVIIPLLSVITNIDYDHQQFLGDTLEAIAGEKAGIIKPNVPVLIGEQQATIQTVFEKKAQLENSALMYAQDICTISDFNNSVDGIQFLLNHKSEQHFLVTDLSGSYQQKNLQTAISAILFLKDKFQIDFNHIENGIRQIRKSTYFLGRFMKIDENPTIIADSAHNEAGIKELIKCIASIDYRVLHFVYGTVNDKDLNKILPLLPPNACYYFCKPNIPRGLDANDLKTKAKTFYLFGETYDSVNQALIAAKNNAHPNDLILIGGSIFVVAELEKLI